MNPAIVPSFSTTQAAEATGIQVDRLQRWLDRGTFELAPTDEATSGTGNRRGWSLRTIRRLGVMAALSRHGVAIARADSVATACIEKCDFISEYERAIAIVDTTGLVKLVTSSPSQSFDEVIDNSIGAGDSLLLLDLSRIFARVSDKLTGFEN